MFASRLPTTRDSSWQDCGRNGEETTQSVAMEASSWCKARSILAALISLALKRPTPGTLIFLFLVVLGWLLLGPSSPLSSSSLSLDEATYSGSSPSEPEEVVGDAVSEEAGDEDTGATTEERRRLRAPAAWVGTVCPEAEVGVTRRFCMSTGSLDVLVWLTQGVGVPMSFSRESLTAAQWAVGEMHVFGETEGESGIVRRVRGASETTAAVSSSLWKGLPR